ncbi:MAG: biotin/lipoyl-binding protein [Clostridia bacterium]|nr:biotin/lipoyl-binding protein [Clostridia bacterium]
MEKVYANMAGIVLNVLVKAGEKIHDGQEVLTLESMKMEVPVQSPAGGTVKEVKVNVGDFVNEGDELLVIKK